MIYSDFYGKLIILTKRNDITHVEIGKLINLEKGAITARAKRNGNLKHEEIKKIEEAFNVEFDSVSVINNSGNPIKSKSAIENSENFGKRLYALQEKNDLTDRQMAKLLGIYEDEYVDLAYGNKEPNLRILNNIKSNFQVSIDYLLYGE